MALRLVMAGKTDLLLIERLTVDVDLIEILVVGADAHQAQGKFNEDKK